MNFLIFRNFSRISSFYEFIWIYFQLKRIKNYIFMAHTHADVSRAKMRHHVTAYEHGTWRRACVCARVRVCARLCMCV